MGAHQRRRGAFSAAGRFLSRHHACLAVAAVAAFVSARPPYAAPGAPIRSDCVGYHLWIREALSGRLSFCDYPVLRKLHAIAYENRERGVCLNKYPPGVALLRFPVMAPLIDLRPGAPIISDREYRASLWFSAGLLAIICFVSASCARRLGANAWATNVSILAVVFGTGLFHYGTFDGCFSHIHSAFVLTLLLWLLLGPTVGENRTRRRGHAFLLGLLAFVSILIRNTNVIAIAWMAAVGAWTLADAGESTSGFRLRRIVLPLLSGAAAAVALQVAYNSWVVGRLMLSSYTERFVWHRPMVLAILASYERGFFSYYPVAGVALAAAFGCGATRRAATALAGLLLAYAALYGFWWSWMLGGGFGHRGFVDVMPFLIPLFAVALGRLSASWRTVTLGASAVAVFVTLELMAGYWRRTLPYQGNTPEIYWSHVAGDESLVAAWVPLGRLRPAR